MFANRNSYITVAVCRW